VSTFFDASGGSTSASVLAVADGTGSTMPPMGISGVIRQTRRFLEGLFESVTVVSRCPVALQNFQIYLQHLRLAAT